MYVHMYAVRVCACTYVCATSKLCQYVCVSQCVCTSMYRTCVCALALCVWLQQPFLQLRTAVNQISLLDGSTGTEANTQTQYHAPSEIDTTNSLSHNVSHRTATQQSS